LENFKPIYQYFRTRDVRHFLADISKAKNLLGYCPRHRIGRCIDEALSSHVKDIIG
jgi:UDP-N-acetylglucosamine 4-epimerase